MAVNKKNAVTNIILLLINIFINIIPTQTNKIINIILL